MKADTVWMKNGVTAKTIVASLKPISVLRLELQAALTRAGLGHHLRKTLDAKISSVLNWSDSETILDWIRPEARRFKVFVARALDEIQDLRHIGEWK